MLGCLCFCDGAEIIERYPGVSIVFFIPGGKYRLSCPFFPITGISCTYQKVLIVSTFLSAFRTKTFLFLMKESFHSPPVYRFSHVHHLAPCYFWNTLSCSGNSYGFFLESKRFSFLKFRIVKG